MNIIQIADLHIGSQRDCNGNEEEILREAAGTLTEYIEDKDQEILVCICGDVIDSNELKSTQKNETRKRYQKANQVLNPLIDRLREKYATVHVGFCLGNHDVTHLNEFLEFARNYDKELDENKLTKGYVIRCKGDVSVCMLNSCSKGQYGYGSVDYAEIEKALGSCKGKIILAMHHAIISEYEADSSCLRNATKLVGLINQHNVIALLNGHIHGGETFTIGKCRVIGVGALFSRSNGDINSQFNIINVIGKVKRVVKFIHLADNKTISKSWEKDSDEEYGINNIFENDDIYILYKELLSQLSDYPVINNALLHTSCSYESFEDTLKRHFYNETVSLGQKNYTYEELADEWENIKLPECLYFNHGMYFEYLDGEKNEKIHGIEEVAKRLKDKPTSNKIVLSTCKGNVATKMLKNEENIPSLLSVQFSKSDDGDTLFMNMYLRALEAGRFLKINICEIGWFLKKLKEQNVSFKNVNIAISAFRVQRKDNFSCFIKSELDSLDKQKLDMLIYSGNKAEVSRLLEEKAQNMETITNYKGVEAVYNAMKILSSGEYENTKNIYSIELVKKMEVIVEKYKQLDNLHCMQSITSDKELEIENEIFEGINEIILELRKGNDTIENDT